MLLRTRQTPHQHQQHSLTAAGASVGPPRAVVTFYYNANRDRDRSGSSNRNGSSSGNRRGGNQKLRAEIDLQDFEVLVETYKFLLTNHRKTLSPQASSSKSRGKALSSSSSHHKKNNSNNSSNNNNKKKHNKKKNDHHLVVTELHKQAIVTLVTVDEVTKRVTEILPEFFPPTTKILPVCLSRLDCLRCLRLDHCSELASFPAGFCLRGLEELGLNVSSFAEPLPASFGETNQLKRLVLYGTCAGLVRPVPSSDSDSSSSNSSNSNSNSNSDDGSSTKNNKNKNKSNSNNYNYNYNPNNMETETVLFPPSMHRIHLEYLETHVQNLLHISPMVLDGWSSSVETLVVTQDLTSSSPLGGSSHHSSVSRKITIPRKQKVTQKQKQKQKQKARVKRNNNAKSFLRRRSFDDDSFGCDDNDEFDILGLSDDDDEYEYEYEYENECNKYNHSSNDSTSSTSSSSSSSNGSNSSEDGGFSILKHGGSVFREALRNQVEERTFRSIAKFQNLKTLRLLFDDSKHRKDYKRKQKKAFATTEDPYCVPLSLLAGPLSLSLRELDISTTHCWGAGVGVGVGVDTQNSRSSTRKAATTSVIPIEVSWIDVLCDFPLLERLALRDCSCSFATGDESAERAKLLEEHDSPLLLPELKQLILDRCPDFALVMANNNNNNNNNTNNTNNNSNNSNTTTTNNNNNSSSSAMEDISFSQHSQHQPQLQRLQQLQSQHQVQVLQHQDCDSDYFLSDHNGSLQEIVFTGAGRTTNTNTNTNSNSNTDEDEFHSDDCGCCHSHSSNSDDDYGEGQICCYYNDDEDDGDNDCLYHRNHHHHHNHNQYYYEGEDCILDPIAMDDIQMMMMDTVMDDYDYEEYDDPLDDHDAISRIVKLTSLVADTTALSPIEREDKLAILCFKFLSRCPKLAVLHLRECQIHGFCRDLLTCLPTDTFSELVLDAVYEDDRLVCRDHNHSNSSNSSSSDNDCCGCVVRNNLWALVDAYPSLVHLQGTYTNGLDDKTEHEKLTKQLVQRRQQQQSLHNHVFAGAAAAVFRGRRPWRMLFANNNNSNSNSNSNNNPEEPEYDPVKASGLEQDTRQARIISMELGEQQKQNQKHHGPQPLPAAPPRAAFRGLPAVRVLGQRLNSIRKNAGLVR